jgi:hypothetical protein
LEGSDPRTLAAGEVLACELERIDILIHVPSEKRDCVALLIHESAGLTIRHEKTVPRLECLARVRLSNATLLLVAA